jgi:glutaminyl-peptide cyclotransferase
MRYIKEIATMAMLTTACSQAGPAAPTAAQGPSAPFYGFLAVNAFPHDPMAFTQGLIYKNGFLYESTGLNGRSSLRKVELETGKVVQRKDVDPKYFAEGLTEWDNRLLQLTWQSNVGFVYDLAKFALQETFIYSGEGWGTHAR